MNADRLGVLRSTRAVLNSAHFVRINEERLHDVCRQLAAEGIQPPPWNSTLHFTEQSERGALHILVLDSLNFCFWNRPRWYVSYHGQVLDGYWALAASLKRAIEGGVPLLDPHYLAEITAPRLFDILLGSGVLPLLPERVANLRQVGQALLAHYHGRFGEVIEQAGGDVVALVQAVTGAFPSFNDVAMYHDHEVKFYKRAQILVGDLAASFSGQGLGAFHNLHELTAFADYKLPQILRRFGIFVYDPMLERAVRAQLRLPAGSDEEIEIRAHTVWAVELMRQELEGQGLALTAYEIDWWLWEASQRLPGQAEPYHRTRTIYY